MEGLLDILSGGTLGALVGTIGSYVNKKLEIKQRAQELSHELSVREMAIREMAAEQTHEINMADKEMQRSKVEGEVEIEKGELAGWVQSMKATGSSIMDTARAIMRPVITVYMLVLVSWLAYRVSVAVGGLENLPSDYTMSLWTQIIGDLMFLTLTVVTWWFGSRPHSRKQ